MKFPCDVIIHCEPNEKGTVVTMTGWNELVRCKDCKYLWHEVAEGFTPYGFYNKRHIFLCQKHFDKYMGELREVMIDDFCSWAERKEE